MPVQWSIRAAQVREEAAALTDPTAKRMLLFVAAGYDRLAEYAASRERLKLPQDVAESGLSES